MPSSGYIVQPQSVLKIPGWRLDLGRVAKFVFSRKPEAYASATSDPANVGVLAVAWFMEQPAVHGLPYNYNNWPAYYGPAQIYYWSSPTLNLNTTPPAHTTVTWTADNTDMPISCSSYTTTGVNAVAGPLETVPQDLGVGFGPASGSRVVLADFQCASSVPVEQMAIRYDSREGLRARGIDTSPVSAAPPNPFPGQFCAPPAGWRRR